jgi:hypothetical protein
MIDVNKGHNKDVDTRYGQPYPFGVTRYCRFGF